MGLDIYFEKRKALNKKQQKEVEVKRARIDELEKESGKYEDSIKNLIAKQFDGDVETTLSEIYGKRASLMYLRTLKEDGDELSENETNKLNEEKKYFEKHKDIAELLDKMQVNVDESGKLAEEIHNIFNREEIAYFRKVNFLMAFFAYVDNCEFVEITKEQVSDLVDRATRVWENHSLAEELLPTQSGFFYGSTEYSDWYFEDVKDVRDTFQEILDNTDWEHEIVEMYCWW